MISVRPPAVAGLFYPAAAAELRRDVAALLAAAAPVASRGFRSMSPKMPPASTLDRSRRTTSRVVSPGTQCGHFSV